MGIRIRPFDFLSISLGVCVVPSSSSILDMSSSSSGKPGDCSGFCQTLTRCLHATARRSPYAVHINTCNHTIDDNHNDEFLQLRSSFLPHSILISTGDLHGQLEDLLLVFYKVSMSETMLIIAPSSWCFVVDCSCSYFDSNLPLERLAVIGDAVRLQRRLCGSRERLHWDSADPVCLPAGVSQRRPPQQRKPRRPYCESEVHGGPCGCLVVAIVYFRVSKST